MGFFGFEGWMWDFLVLRVGCGIFWFRGLDVGFFWFRGLDVGLIVMVPDHCLSFYFACLVLMSKYLNINTLSD